VVGAVEQYYCGGIFYHTSHETYYSSGKLRVRIGVGVSVRVKVRIQFFARILPT